MLRYITLAIIALFLAAPAHAATKDKVAAYGCKSLVQERKAHPADHLNYRLINGDKCWYSEAALAGQLPKVAKASPVIIKRTAVKPVVTPPQSEAEDLDSVFELICGGPCPQLKGEHRDQWPRRPED